jgi:hypothetical protein
MFYVGDKRIKACVILTCIIFQRTDKLSSSKIQENDACLFRTHRRDFTKKYRNYWPKAVYVELEEHYVKVDLKWQGLLRDMERRVI